MYYIVGFVLFMLSSYAFKSLVVMSATISGKKTMRLDFHFLCKGFIFMYLITYTGVQHNVIWSSTC